MGTDGKFSYTLKDNTTDVNQAGTPETDSFSYTAKDANGNIVTNTVTITIEDDKPVLNVTNGFIADESNGTLLGTLVNMGADGGASTGAITWNSVAAKIITQTGTESNVTLTSGGKDVLITVSGDTITGTTTSTVGTTTTTTTIFTIVGHADGTYTTNLSQPLDTSKLFPDRRDTTRLW